MANKLLESPKYQVQVYGDVKKLREAKSAIPCFNNPSFMLYFIELIVLFLILYIIVVHMSLHSLP